MADSTAIPGTTLRLVSYGISYEPLPDPKYELPAEIKEQTDALYPSIAEKPAEAIPILEGWVARYPNAPKLLNFLSAAYSCAKMPQKARALAERNFHANPDYLFAKLNHAEFFLREKNFEKVKEIMGDKWDLSLHYPERKKFHISEALGFLGTAGRYMAGIGKVDAAKSYLDIIKKLAPDSPAAKALEDWIAIAQMRKTIKHFRGGGRQARRERKRNARKKRRE